MILMMQNQFNLIPRSISNISLWIDASQLGLADDASVVQLTDYSSLSNHGTQSTSSFRGTFKSNIINGLPVVRFDGTNDMYSCGNMFAAKPSNYTVFCIHRFSDVSTNKCVYASINTAGQNRHSWCLSATYASSRELWSFGTGGGGLSGYRYGNTTNTVFDTTNFAIHTQRFTSGATEVQIWKNSILQVNTSISGGATTTGGTLYPFTVGSMNTSWYYQGDLAELIVYNRNLSDTERLTVENYLKTKYGL